MLPSEVELLLGDYSKAREKLDWQPKVTCQELAEIMIEADMKLALDEEKLTAVS